MTGEFLPPFPTSISQYNGRSFLLLTILIFPISYRQATISSAVLGKADLALNWARKASDISLHHVGPRHIQHKRDREIVEGLESIEMKRIISKAVAWQDRDLHEFEDNYESKCDCDEITWPGKNLMSWVAMLVRRGPVYWDDEWEVAQR